MGWSFMWYHCGNGSWGKNRLTDMLFIDTEKTKKKLFRIAEIVHLRLFGHPMGEEMRKFLGHLSWSFFGGIISLGLFFFINILAGRLLGPVEYGKYGLIYAAAVLVANFFLFGLDSASIKFVNTTMSIQETKRVISTTSFLFVMLLVIVSCFLFLFGGHFTSLLRSDGGYLGWVLLFGSTFAFRNFGDAIIRSLHLFRFQSFIRVGEAALVMSIFLILYFGTRERGFGIYILSLVSGYLLYGLFFLWKTHGNFTIIRKNDIMNVVPYAAFSFFGGIAGLLLAYSDKLLIGRYIGVGELGVYNAYDTASVMVMSQLAVMFVNVFFPVISGRERKVVIYGKIRRFLKYAFIPSSLFISVGLFVALKLFGSQYPIDLLDIVLFSIYSYLYTCFVILWWVLASAGVRGIRFTSMTSMVSFLIFLALFFIFREGITIRLVLVFLGVAMAFNVLMANKYHERILQR